MTEMEKPVDDQPTKAELEEEVKTDASPGSRGRAGRHSVDDRIRRWKIGRAHV